MRILFIVKRYEHHDNYFSFYLFEGDTNPLTPYVVDDSYEFHEKILDKIEREDILGEAIIDPRGLEATDIDEVFFIENLFCDEDCEGCLNL